MKSRQVRRQEERERKKNLEKRYRQAAKYQNLDTDDKRILAHNKKVDFNLEPGEIEMESYHLDPKKLTDMNSVLSDLRIVAEDIVKSRKGQEYYIIYIEHCRYAESFDTFIKSANTVLTKIVPGQCEFIILIGDLIKYYIKKNDEATGNKSGIPLIGALLMSKDMYIRAYHYQIEQQHLMTKQTIQTTVDRTTGINFGSSLSEYITRIREN